MKGDQPREKKVQKWVNEELPHTKDGLVEYQKYLNGELSHCKAMLKRLNLLASECHKRIELMKKQGA